MGDIVCPIDAAQAIVDVLNQRQKKLGHEFHGTQKLHQIDKGSRATEKKQRAQGKTPKMHAYQDTAFLQPWFMQLLLDTTTVQKRVANGSRRNKASGDAHQGNARGKEPNTLRSRSRQRYNERNRDTS